MGKWSEGNREVTFAGASSVIPVGCVSEVSLLDSSLLVKLLWFGVISFSWGCCVFVRCVVFGGCVVVVESVLVVVIVVVDVVEVEVVVVESVVWKFGVVGIAVVVGEAVVVGSAVVVARELKSRGPVGRR